MEAYDGGPAFPSTVLDSTGVSEHYGMSRLDYLAGQVVTGILAGMSGYTPAALQEDAKAQAVFASFAADVARTTVNVAAALVDALDEYTESAHGEAALPTPSSLLRTWEAAHKPDHVTTVAEALAEEWSAEGKPGHKPGCTTYAGCVASGCDCSCHD